MVDDGGWSNPDESARNDEARTDGQGPIDPSPDPSPDGSDDEEAAVAGSFSPDVDVSPGTPKPESVVFVALGVYVTMLAIGRLIAGPEMYEPTTLAAVTFAVAAGAALLYGFFVRTD